MQTLLNTVFVTVLSDSVFENLEGVGVDLFVFSKLLVGVLSQMTYLHSVVDAKTAKACLFPQVRLVLVRRRGRENMKYIVCRGRCTGHGISSSTGSSSHERPRS